MSDEIVLFLQKLGSVWALRLVLLLSENPKHSWEAAELVKELRASEFIVGKLMPQLRKLNLVIETAKGHWKWRPATPELENVAREVTRFYAVKPFAVIQVIAKMRGRARRTVETSRIRK
jgi:hypothetical protein